MSASIFAITPTAASVLANGALPLTTIARRQCGCVSQLGSDSIVLERAGYYKVTATVTFTVPVAGVATVALKQDNQEVPGITASQSIDTATTQVGSLVLSGIVRVMYGSGASVLQLVNTGVAIDTSNISIDVIYLG